MTHTSLQTPAPPVDRPIAGYPVHTGAYVKIVKVRRVGVAVSCASCRLTG
jgi:hypothetical protein